MGELETISACFCLLVRLSSCGRLAGSHSFWFRQSFGTSFFQIHAPAGLNPSVLRWSADGLIFCSAEGSSGPRFWEPDCCGTAAVCFGGGPRTLCLAAFNLFRQKIVPVLAPKPRFFTSATILRTGSCLPNYFAGWIQDILLLLAA